MHPIQFHSVGRFLKSTVLGGEAREIGVSSENQRVYRSIPSSWIANLRVGISRPLSNLVVEGEVEHPSGKLNGITLRLQALKALHDSALITDDEYLNKKESILNGF